MCQISVYSEEKEIVRREIVKNKKVLVVDDEPYILRSLRMILEMEGYMVDTATDGLEALKKVSESKPHLILLDIMMPHMDGYEVAKRLKEDPSTSDIFILILTAKGQEKDKIHSLSLGADEHLTKPFSPNKLLERVKEILGE